jgi:tryptophan synthase beta chain
VRECCECEGILPALESAHALAAARRYAAEHPAAKILIGLSGRGDKDMPTLSRTLLAPAPEPGAAATTATVAIGKFK